MGRDLHNSCLAREPELVPVRGNLSVVLGRGRVLDVQPCRHKARAAVKPQPAEGGYAGPSLVPTARLCNKRYSVEQDSLH